MREKGWDIAIALARGGRPVVAGSAVPSVKPDVADSLCSLWSRVFPQPGGSHGRCVLVTAARSGEGVSQIATGLALAGLNLAPSCRIALVDFNLYQPGVGRLFRLPAMPGVAEALSGELPLAELPVQTQDMALDVLPAGCPNGLDLSPPRSEKVAELIERLREDYDCVILDGPAIDAGETTSMLAPMVDGVLLVIRAAITPRDAVSDARSRLERVGARIVGAVLNG